jgi:hypothetical protein
MRGKIVNKETGQWLTGEKFEGENDAVGGSAWFWFTIDSDDSYQARSFDSSKWDFIADRKPLLDQINELEVGTLFYIAYRDMKYVKFSDTQVHRFSFWSDGVRGSVHNIAELAAANNGREPDVHVLEWSEFND